MMTNLESAREMREFLNCLPGAGRGQILVMVPRYETWTPAFAGETVIYFGLGAGRTQ